MVRIYIFLKDPIRVCTERLRDPISSQRSFISARNHREVLRWLLECSHFHLKFHSDQEDLRFPRRDSLDQVLRRRGEIFWQIGDSFMLWFQSSPLKYIKPCSSKRTVKGNWESGAVVWTACLSSNQTGLGPLLTIFSQDSAHTRGIVSVLRSLYLIHLIVKLCSSREDSQGQEQWYGQPVLALTRQAWAHSWQSFPETQPRVTSDQQKIVIGGEIFAPPP